MVYGQAKQHEDEKKNRFLVPFNQNHPLMCFACRVMDYRHLLDRSLLVICKDDDVFHRSMRSGYSSQVMGKNKLAGIRKDVATEPGLEEAESFTSHHFHRTSATEALNCKATSVGLNNHFGLVQESTTRKYVDEMKEQSRKMAHLLPLLSSSIYCSHVKCFHTVIYVGCVPMHTYSPLVYRFSAGMTSPHKLYWSMLRRNFDVEHIHPGKSKSITLLKFKLPVPLAGTCAISEPKFRTKV